MALTPAQARQQLLDQAAEFGHRWITTEMLCASRRARERHEAAENARVAADAKNARQLRALAEDLTDDDLSWLLATGWDPTTTGAPL